MATVGNRRMLHRYNPGKTNGFSNICCSNGHTLILIQLLRYSKAGIQPFGASKTLLHSKTVILEFQIDGLGSRNDSFSRASRPALHAKWMYQKITFAQLFSKVLESLFDHLLIDGSAMTPKTMSRRRWRQHSKDARNCVKTIRKQFETF